MPRWRLVPRDESFFSLFVKQARNIETAAGVLHDLITDYAGTAEKAGRLRDLEHEGDEMTHEVMRRLNTVFVTPLDHEDIHKLTSLLDDVLDHMEAARRVGTLPSPGDVEQEPARWTERGAIGRYKQWLGMLTRGYAEAVPVFDQVKRLGTLTGIRQLLDGA